MDKLPFKVVENQKTSNRKEQRDIIRELMGKSFIGRYREHIDYFSALVNHGHPNISIYFKLLQNKYIYFKEIYNWSDYRFKTIVWNIAKNNDNIFDDKIYKRYEIKYINNELEEPFDE